MCAIVCAFVIASAGWAFPEDHLPSPESQVAGDVDHYKLYRVQPEPVSTPSPRSDAIRLAAMSCRGRAVT